MTAAVRWKEAPASVPAAAARIHIDPDAIVLLPPKVRSSAALLRYVNFEDQVRANPGHELFVLWFRQDPENLFAVTMKIAKAKIAAQGWPLLVDPETRVVEFCAPEALT